MSNRRFLKPEFDVVLIYSQTLSGAGRRFRRFIIWPEPWVFRLRPGPPALLLTAVAKADAPVTAG